MENQTKIKCPNCNTEIDVNDILSHQITEATQKKFNALLAEEKKKYEAQEAILLKEKEEFEEKKKRENELFQERLAKELKEGKLNLEASIKKKLEEENAERLAAMNKELNENAEKVKELYKIQQKVAELEREKLIIKDQVMAEAQKGLNEKMQIEAERIKKAEEEKNELRFKELQKQLEDQKKLTEEMKRKQDQGSMQLQGEVQELAIEEWLESNFPLDTISEIKKGARGADCVQIVNTRVHQNCGSIYYESKRTKDFQSGWIEKFKTDMRDKGADIGVLVTEVLPKEMERMGMKDGVWVCTFQEFKGLSLVLRETVVKLHSMSSSQENKGDKMVMLYDYLTGNTFRSQVEAIVEGFSQMKADLESEKRAMQRIWKQREKQLDKVTVNTIDMHASIKGIAGKAIQSINLLELSAPEDGEE